MNRDRDDARSTQRESELLEALGARERGFATLLSAQDAHRAQLAHRLHDDICQRMAVLAINLHRLRQAPASTEGHETQSVELAALCREAQALAKAVREICENLHPASVEQLGLAAAVRGLCDDVSEAHGLPIVCDAPDGAGMPWGDSALGLYRVAEEALRNVIAHSGARAASVEVGIVGDDVRLRVRDDGCGFDVADVERGSSVGLTEMRVRVQSMGGRLSICSAHGEGTQVEARVPLARRAD